MDRFLADKRMVMLFREMINRILATLKEGGARILRHKEESAMGQRSGGGGVSEGAEEDSEMGRGAVEEESATGRRSSEGGVSDEAEEWWRRSQRWGKGGVTREIEIERGERD
ncbi:uncharacterized protein A4U43_C10F14330 [Asparagus officinalis]|uniref:Uncharacterized protein n=1 Tax=Asparagus officinalis TaxID=4686 RepID=A0A5P1E4I8_ASPOF|nr:uncharacterized protein A4U43_C10F14330 [Asparagus officinalis]